MFWGKKGPQKKHCAKIQKMLLFAKRHVSDVVVPLQTQPVQIRTVNIFANQMRSHSACQLFSNKALPNMHAHTLQPPTHPHCDNPSRSDCLFQPKSDDWSQVMWVCGGGRGGALVGAYEGGGCMRDVAVVLICLKCVPPTNTTEVSTASLPPPQHPGPPGS